MDIVVCMKQIIDPETPAEDFEIDSDTRRGILPRGREFVISDYDASAIEAALQIKDKHDAQITLISLGPERATEALRKALGMGADEAILIDDPAFDDSDSFMAADALSQAIRKLENFDLVLCGRQEGEWDAGQVGLGIAELLNIPSVSCIGGIKVKDESIVAERVVGDGREFIELQTPALMTISSEIGVPRHPPLKGVMAAFDKTIQVWGAQDIKPAATRNRLLELFIPEPEEGQCEFISGDSPEEAGMNLAVRLRDAKII